MQAEYPNHWLPRSISCRQACRRSILGNQRWLDRVIDQSPAIFSPALHGRGRLTIKLTLWCLAMMAANGDSFVDYSYPDLDSWRYGGKGYVHNTSGTKKAKLSRNDSHQEPDLQRAAGEGACEVDNPSFISTAPGYREEEDEVDKEDDDQTELGAPIRRKKVTIEKHTVNRKLYFVDAKGNKKDTSKEEWRKVDGGYELIGRKHVYFTKKFP